MEPIPEKNLTLRDLVRLLKRRRAVVYVTAVSFCVLAALYCLVATRRYEAIGTIQVQKASSDAMGLDHFMGGAETSSDALDTNIDIQTQASILQSDSLALRTIENLHMEGTQDFQTHWDPIGAVLGLFSPSGPSDPSDASLENAPRRRTRLLKTFEKRLTVKPVSGTRLIEIHYMSPDPRLAAAVVNDLSQGLVEYSYQTRTNATNQTSQWLRGQLSDLRQQSEELQAKAAALASQNGIYNLGTTDATGHEQAYSGVLDRLQQSTAALQQAEQSRILRGAIEEAAQSGNVDMLSLSGLAGNTMGNNLQSVGSSLTLLQNLRQQEATQRAALKEAEAKFGSSYPKLQEMRGNISSMEYSIRQEIERIKLRAKSDYEVAVQAEANLRKAYEAAKEEAEKVNDKGTEYAIVRQEADDSRTLYESLLKRFHEAGALQGLRSSNIDPVDPGRVPAKPKTPNVALYMLIALVAGTFLGGIGAVVADAMDGTVTTIAAVEEITGQPILGATPVVKATKAANSSEGKANLLTVSDPQSTYSEAMRGICAAFLAKTQQTKVVLATSAIAGEGSATFASNLAVLLARSGRKVLLVDADLRHSTLSSTLGLPSGTGLSELLSGIVGEPRLLTLSGAPRLDVVSAGSKGSDAIDLLGARLGDLLAFWRSKYDFIVLSGAPLLSVSDSVVVNPLADFSILLTRPRWVEPDQLKRAYSLLHLNSLHPVGVVVNGLYPDDKDYYGYYGRRTYSSHNGKDANATLE